MSLSILLSTVCPICVQLSFVVTIQIECSFVCHVHCDALDNGHCCRLRGHVLVRPYSTHASTIPLLGFLSVVWRKSPWVPVTRGLPGYVLRCRGRPAWRDACPGGGGGGGGNGTMLEGRGPGASPSQGGGLGGGEVRQRGLSLAASMLAAAPVFWWLSLPPPPPLK